MRDEAWQRIRRRLVTRFTSAIGEASEVMRKEGPEPPPAEITELAAKLAASKPGEGGQLLEAWDEEARAAEHYMAVLITCFGAIRDTVAELEAEGLLHSHEQEEASDE